MQKITLTKIYTSDKDKNGNPLISKAGKPYTRMSIKCNEFGDEWISGFKNKVSSNWKEGDTVDVEIIKNGKFMNFNTPKQEDLNRELMEKILNRLTSINLDIQLMKEKICPKVQGPVKTEAEYPEEDIDIDNIPF